MLLLLNFIFDCADKAKKLLTICIFFLFSCEVDDVGALASFSEEVLPSIANNGTLDVKVTARRISVEQLVAHDVFVGLTYDGYQEVQHDHHQEYFVEDEQ